MIRVQHLIYSASRKEQPIVNAKRVGLILGTMPVLISTNVCQLIIVILMLNVSTQMEAMSAFAIQVLKETGQTVFAQQVTT